MNVNSFFCIRRKCSPQNRHIQGILYHTLAVSSKCSYKFGFAPIFYCWIYTTPRSAHLLLCMIGKKNWFLNLYHWCQTRRPSFFSSFFCIAEEVLSRGIPNLVDNRDIKLMRGVLEIVMFLPTISL